MTEKYFDKPTQVKFYDGANHKWLGGIAYLDEIICGCCGGILGVDEFKENEIVEYDAWVNISDEIIGEN